MNAEKVQRNIGIIGDGRTDRIIFGEIVKCILTEDTEEEYLYCNIIELQRKNIIRPVQDYLKAEDKNLNSDPSISKDNYDLAVAEIAGRLYQVFDDFINEVGSSCNCDILVLTTDAERALKDSEAYFDYGIKLFHLLSEAIIRFYKTLSDQGYSQEYIPLVLPLATFPSTEIIIAAAKGLESSKYQNKNPRELKDILYTRDPGKLTTKELEDQALKFITQKGIKNVFKNIPESRHFIQTLSCYQVSCFLELI